MNPVSAIVSVLQSLLNFRGRASRSEFWWFFAIALVVALVVLGWFSGLWTFSYFLALSLLWFLPSFAFLLPAIYLVVMPAATVRRLHDTDRSARWLLFPVIVIVGWGIIAGVAWLVGATSDDGWGAAILALLFGGIWSLVGLVMMVAMTIVLALPGTVGPNRYGPGPLRPELGYDRMPHPAHASDATPDASGVSATGDDFSPPDSSKESGQANRRFCTQCGTQLQAEARFCTLCGTSV